MRSHPRIELRPDTVLRLRQTPLVLMYHTVDEVAEDPYRLAIPPRLFAHQLDVLRRMGLRGVGIGDLLAAMVSGRSRGLVGLTFDDGYRAVVDHALPQLRRRGFGATVFVVTDRLGGTNDWDGGAWPLVDAEDVRHLVAEGIEIGSHSATHARLPTLDPGLLRTELCASRERLADLLGAAPRGFAYPYGAVDTRTRDAVRDAGYGYACAVNVPRSALSALTLPRSYAGANDTTVRFAAKRALHRARLALKGGHL